MTYAANSRCLEQLAIGDIYLHAKRRTITWADNSLYNTLAFNPESANLDEVSGAPTLYEDRPVSKTLLFCLVCSVGEYDFLAAGMTGSVGYGDLRFTRPVFIGDTIRAESEVVDKRDSVVIPRTGIIELESRAYNQRNELVLKFRNFMGISKRY